MKDFICLCEQQKSGVNQQLKNTLLIDALGIVKASSGGVNRILSGFEDNIVPIYRE